MRHPLTWMLCLLACLAMAAHGADIYKTVDDRGRIIYSDAPVNQSSEKVKLEEANTMPATPLQAPRKESEREDDTNAPPQNYQVRITNPPAEHHVMPGTFDVGVQVSTKPALHPSHRVSVTDNGDWVEGMTINNIIRGSHELQAHVLDQNGRVISSSPVIMVYVHRPTVAN